MFFIRRLLGPLVIGAGAVTLYFWLNATALNANAVLVNALYGQQFFAVFSTLYAITMALVLVKGVETVNALTGSVLREATKIRTVASLSDAFQDDAARASMRHLRAELVMYIDNIRAQRGADRSRKNDGVIDGCRRIVAAAPGGEEGLKVELLRELEALRLLRAERASLAATRLPAYLIWMLAVMTLVIIAPFFAEHSGFSGPMEPKAIAGAVFGYFNYYAIFMLSTFGSFLFFTILDINKPYDGLWKVDFAPFDEAAAELSGAGA